MNINLLHTRKVLLFLALSVSGSLSMANASAAVFVSQEAATQEAVTQEAEAQGAQATSKDKDLEVIGVVGERSLGYFRVEMEKAELDFYDAFNVLAQNPKFKVQCRRQKRVASNISTKVCHPQYVLNRMAQETQEALERGLPQPTFKEIEFAVEKEREESMAYVEKIVTENPQLLKKLIALNERQAKYEEARASN